MAATPEPAATAETATILVAAAALCSGAAASRRFTEANLAAAAAVRPIGLQP